MKKQLLALIGLCIIASCSTDESQPKETALGLSYSSFYDNNNSEWVVTNSLNHSTGNMDSTIIVSLDKNEMTTIRYKYNENEKMQGNWVFIGAEIERQTGTNFEKAVYEKTDKGLIEIDRMSGNKPLVIPSEATEMKNYYEPLNTDLSIEEVYNLMF